MCKKWGGYMFHWMMHISLIEELIYEIRPAHTYIPFFIDFTVRLPPHPIIQRITQVVIIRH